MSKLTSEVLRLGEGSQIDGFCSRRNTSTVVRPISHDIIKRMTGRTHTKPNPIMPLRYTFCDFFIFKFQNREAG